MRFRKNWTTSTTPVGFEPLTSVVRVWRINHWVSGDWMAFQNISNIYICQDSVFVCGRTSSHKIQVNSDPDPKNKSLSTPRHKTNQFGSLNWNQVKFDPSHWNQVNIDHPAKNQVNHDPHTKTKNLSTPTLKPSQVRSLHWSQVKFDPHYKSSQFWCRDTKTMFISGSTLKSSLFWPHTKTKSILTPTM